MQTIVIIGQGQLGNELAHRHLQQHDTVYSVSRSKFNNTPALHHHLVADLDKLTNALTIPEPINCLYYLAPPADTNLTDQRIRNFLRLHSSLTIGHIVYISTSGVYGDSQGEWITEQSAVNPAADRARRRLDAEQQLYNYHETTNTDVTILRCAAIYSDRTVNHQRIVANQKPVIKPQQAPFTNRIHLYDLNEVCWQVMQQKPVGFEIFNVSDGHPSTTTEHAWLLADMAGIERKPSIELSDAAEFYSPAYMSYLKESKKLDISKLRETINLDFKYENVINGILQCLNQAKKD